MGVSLCNNKHRLLINVAFLKPAILCSKPPLALRSRLDFGLSRKRFFFVCLFVFLSEIIIGSFNNSELRNAQWQRLSYHHALATGQCPVFLNNNLRTPGSFGSFSRCGDEVSR